MTHHGPFSVEQWFDSLFSSKAAREGRIVRRQLRDVDRYIGRARLAKEISRRGYHAIENAGQIVIFCNREPIRRFRQANFFAETGPGKSIFSGGRICINSTRPARCILHLNRYVANRIAALRQVHSAASRRGASG